MLPLPAAIISRPTRWLQKNAPFRLVDHVVPVILGDLLGGLAGYHPGVVDHTSIRHAAALTVDTCASIDSRDFTSSGTHTASPPV